MTRLRRAACALMLALALSVQPAYALCLSDIQAMFAPESGVSLAEATGTLGVFDYDIFAAIAVEHAAWYSAQCETPPHVCPNEQDSKTFWYFELLTFTNTCQGGQGSGTVCEAYQNGGVMAAHYWLLDHPTELYAVEGAYWQWTGGGTDWFAWLDYYLLIVCYNM